MYSSQEWWSSGVTGNSGGSDQGDPIGQSLRFRGNQWLQRTFGSTGSQTNFTISLWFKKAVPTDAEAISFLAAGTLGSGSSATRDQFDIEMPQFFRFFGSNQNIFDSNQVRLRDPSAWYHVVISCDMTSAISTDRIRVFYNGQRQVSLDCPITSFNFFNTAVEHRIGTEGIGVWTEGYYAEYYFIDGQALEPTTFGRRNANDVWVPVTPENLTYGTNGFHLTFDPTQDSDPQVAIGIDSSGNDNHFTSNGFELGDQTSVLWDHMEDSPTQNWATLNPLGIDYPAYFPKIKDANLSGDTSGSEADLAMFDTIALPPGKWYYEATFTSDLYLGVAEVFNGSNNRVAYVAKTGTIIREGTFTDSTENTSIGVLSSGTVACKVDTDAREIAFSTDGITWDTTTYATPQSGVLYAYLSAGIIQPSNTLLAINFGQRPFLYTPPAGFEALQTQNLPEADILNGRDHFQAITGSGQGADSGVAGQLAGNFSSDVTSSTGAWFDAGHTPDKMFNGVFGSAAQSGQDYTQTSTQDATLTFTPSTPIPFTDKVEVNMWPRANLNTYNVTVDGVTTQVLITPTDTDKDTWFTLASGGGNFEGYDCTGYFGGTPAAIRIDGQVLVDGNILALAQRTFPNGLWWIKDRVNSNPHQIVNSLQPQATETLIWETDTRSQGAYTAPAGNSVAWCWSAPEEWTGTGSTACLRNRAAGFSIVRVPLTGPNTPVTTVLHGLDDVPEFMLWDIGDGTMPWMRTWHRDLNAGNMIYLNRSAQQGADASQIVPTPGDPTSINIGVTSAQPNNYTSTAYCWHSVPGYSAFGSYTGNGDPGGDGPFIYLGFRPALIIVKVTNTNGFGWYLMDTTRSPFNGFASRLEANEEHGENTAPGDPQLDFLSNGFKLRTGNSNTTNEYIYAAFAENPFGGNNVSPANAR